MAVSNPKPRPAISQRMRFDILKRDNYTCQYCGQRAPQAVLEIDHVVPRAGGGPDVIDNYLTACKDCNRGKGATVLPGTAVEVERAEEPAKKSLMVGRFFHRLNPNGSPKWQGRASEC